ncbi:hypothetical protein GTV32_15080 [Gordonia sp. SID5947]|uniref:hypothetical protein n=1 Tax=Gordonia sp. SID5947 TaxID=2690315 RepID=UPI001370A7CE|nr:hypothetical protein [Gordonia sp. SID5947]MYR07543.1 hypothetical protein [Gordonia sp. SID5947]
MGVEPGESIPEGFTETTNDFTFIATRRVTPAELSALCSVDTYCTWKNSTWKIARIDRVRNVATLKIALTLKGDYPEVKPWPQPIDFRSVPTVDYMDREWIAVDVRPEEMARVMLLVTAFETPPPVTALLDDEVQAWPDSVGLSPWLPAEDALAVVRGRIAGEDLGSYPVDRLQADRLRDGWRVWAVPPVSDDPLDVRLGWAVWYVADDGVVWRSSTSTDFGVAEQRLTDQLFERLQATRRG